MISGPISSETKISLTVLQDYSFQRKLLKAVLPVDYRTSRYEKENKENPILGDIRDMRVNIEEDHPLQ